MSKICIDSIQKAFPDADIEEVSKIVEHLKEQKPKFKDRINWNEYVKNYISDQKDRISAEMAEKLTTHEMYLSNVDYIKSYGDTKQALLSMVEEVSDLKEGSGMSIPRIMESKFKIYNNGLISAMNQQGILDAFRSGTFDIDVIDYLRTGDLPAGPQAKLVQDIGDTLTHFYDTMLLDLNSSGFNINKKAGYFGKIVHDGLKISGKFNEWVTSLKNNYDIKKSFDIDNDADLAEFLYHQGDHAELKNNEYVKALMEDYGKITKDSVFNDGEEAMMVFHGRQDTAARTRAKGRGYEPKSGANLKAYLEEFGQSSTLADMYGTYAMRTSKDVALLRAFGPNYNAGIDQLKNYLKQTMAKEEFDKAWVPFEISLNRTIGNSPSVVTSGPYKHLGTIRKLTTLAYIGKSGMTQLLDTVPTAIHYHSATGKPFAQAAYETFTNYLSAIPEAMRKNTAEEMYLFTNDMLTSINQELMEVAQGKAGMMSKAAEAVFTLSGAKFMNKVSYITNAKLYLRRLNDIANGAEINANELAHLGKFNITPADVKQILPEFKAQGLNMSLFGKLDDTIFENNRLGIPAKEYKVQMQERFTAYLTERIQKGSPVAGNREKRFLYGATQEGTLQGEAARALAQFKVTATKIMFDTFVGLAKEQGGYKNASTYYMLGKWLAASSTMGIGLLALKDYARQPIGDILEGKTPEQWDDGITKDILAKGMLAGGGALLVGDLLYNINDPKEMWQAFMTPAVSAPLGIISAPFAIGSDYYENGYLDDATQKQIEKTLRSVTPLQNWYFATPLIEGFKAGQIDLME